VLPDLPVQQSRGTGSSGGSRLGPPDTSYRQQWEAAESRVGDMQEEMTLLQERAQQQEQQLGEWRHQRAAWPPAGSAHTRSLPHPTPLSNLQECRSRTHSTCMQPALRAFHAAQHPHWVFCVLVVAHVLCESYVL
jgi:hypothetical protein